MSKILLLQGANMAWLGRREPEIYGIVTASELDALVRAHAEAGGHEIEIFYTHVEGEAIARVYQAVDQGFHGLIMNPAGFTYSGYALRDCLRACPGLPYVEVHMSNLAKRGMHSVIAEAAKGLVMGFGADSYLLALDAMDSLLNKG